jgi:hypothetical protein
MFSFHESILLMCKLQGEKFTPEERNKFVPCLFSSKEKGKLKRTESDNLSDGRYAPSAT